MFSAASCGDIVPQTMIGVIASTQSASATQKLKMKR